MRRSTLFTFVLLVLAGTLAPVAGRAGPGRSAPVTGDTVPAAAPNRFLARLPDGPEKRQFVLDCTGCHQLDARMVRPDGAPRTEASWRERVAQMLSFAGPRTGFPVISTHADAERYASWLTEHLGNGLPAPAVAVAGGSGRGAGARVREYPLPDPSDLPHDLVLDPEGRPVVTGMMSGTMWVLEPVTGAYEQVAIPRPQANPRALDVDASGGWWVLLGFPRLLGHRSPAGAWSFHELGVYPHSIVRDRDGGVWYNDHFARDSTVVFRLDPETGATRRFAIAPPATWTPASGTTIPYGLRLGRDGAVWGTELAGNRLLRLDPRTGASNAYPLPTPRSGPRRLEVASDGTVWVPEYANNRLARFDPRTGQWREWELPVPDALPYVIRLDEGRGRVWIGTAGADALILFEPATERFSVVALSPHALTRHLAVDPESGAVWGATSPSPSLAPRVFRVDLP